MAEANKIEFGLSSIFFAPLTTTVAADGTETHTYEEPIALRGAKSMSLSPEGEQSTQYADDTAWFTSTVNNGYSGDLGFIYFSDAIRETIFKNVKTASGLIVERTDVEPVEGAILYQCQGDKRRIRHVLYNVKFGNPSVDHATKEDGIEPTEVTIPYTASPIRLSTGELVVKAKCVEGDEAYDTFFSSVALPKMPTLE